MKLITETFEDVEVLAETKQDGKKTYSIHGVFMQAEEKNKNGRIYPLPILEKEVDRYTKDYVQRNRAVGELGHPSGPTINLERVSHKITELRRDGNNFIGKAKILETQPHGKIVRGLLDEGIQLGVSSRGIGSLVEKEGANYVGEDFYLSTIDIVADPSAPEAFVNGVLEGKDFIWESGVFKEVDLSKVKTVMNKAAARRETEQAMLESFSQLMRGLSRG